MPDAEVIIAHIHNSLMDQSLKLCLDKLNENTEIDIELFIDDRPGVCPYQKWNDRCKASQAKTVVFINNDMVMAPGWDCMARDVAPNTIVTGRLVESGILSVNQVNLERDFGRHPDEFTQAKYEEFCRFVAGECVKHPPRVTGERGWYMPMAVDRAWFVSIGGYDCHIGRFPEPLDVYFYRKSEAQPGFQHIRANSWAYHFQRLSLLPRTADWATA